MLNAIVNTSENNQMTRSNERRATSFGIKILFVLSFILPLAAVGNAQINKKTEFEVPYEFVVGDKILPAGKYVVSSANEQKTAWKIAGKAAGQPTVFLVANTVEGSESTDEAKLIFRQYGNLYFMTGFAVSDFRITLSRSKTERGLQREFLGRNQPVATRIVKKQEVPQVR